MCWVQRLLPAQSPAGTVIQMKITSLESVGPRLGAAGLVIIPALVIVPHETGFLPLRLAATDHRGLFSALAVLLSRIPVIRIRVFADK